MSLNEKYKERLDALIKNDLSPLVNGNMNNSSYKAEIENMKTILKGILLS